MPESPPDFPALDLPRFADRLPDLSQALRQTAGDLTLSLPAQSYIPYWEDLYAVSHNLKGVLSILSSPPAVADFIVAFTETLKNGLMGDAVCRKNKEAGALMRQTAAYLDGADPAALDAAELGRLVTAFAALYTRDVGHEDRLREVPSHLYHVSELVSKKAREITLLNLNHCVLEDEILLDEIPLWRTQLNETLLSPEFGRGLVVSFLPFISSEGSRRLKVWAWIAAATHSRAALKQRVKEVMPKVAITKL